MKEWKHRWALTDRFTTQISQYDSLFSLLACIDWTAFIKHLSNLLTTQSALQLKSAISHSHTQSQSKGRWFLHKEPTRLSGTHTHTFTLQWPSHLEQFGVQCLAQGDFDMWIREAGDRTTNRLTGRQPVVPTEPQPPHMRLQMDNKWTVFI